MKIQFLIIILLLITSHLIAQDFWFRIADLNSTPACFAFDSSGCMYTGTLDHGIYFSSDKGNSWIGKNNGLNDLNIYSIAILQNGWIFVGTFNHGIFYTTNNGALWMPSGLFIQDKVRSIVVTNSGALIAGTDGSGIYRSTNNGGSWQKTIYPPKVFSLCVTSTGNIIAGCRTPNSIYVSVDDGLIWEEKFSSAQTFNTVVSSINDKVYAITGDYTTSNLISYIFARSDDDGLHWIVPISFTRSSLGMTSNTNGDVFVGKYNTVWETTNAGLNWLDLQSGIGVDTLNINIISLACSPDGYIFAGRQGGFLYRSSQSTISVKLISSNVPKIFSLYQNYPNPFNPSTKIKFDIPAVQSSNFPNNNSDVKLIVYDIAGREVLVLLNKNLNPGTYEFEFNTNKYSTTLLSSGVYFYTLVYKSLSKTLPMVLIK